MIREGKHADLRVRRRPSSLKAGGDEGSGNNSQGPFKGNVPPPAPRQRIEGYTPSDFVSFSEEPEQVCHHMAAVTVQGVTPAICFSIWDDWNRLVDFLDLVCQVGVTP